MRFSFLLANSALVASMSFGIGRAQTAAVNPLKGDLGVHDPVMIKGGDTYYVFYTGNGIAVKTSTDRITWKNAGSALKTMPAWHKQYVSGGGSDLWAPDISYRAGKYWLYYALSSFGSNTSVIGLATATTLEPANGATQWVDQGMVVHSVSSNDYNAIDPNVVLDSAGTPWLIFGSFWTGIKMVKMDAATGKPVEGAQLLSIAEHGNRGAIEGGFAIRQGAYYYLFVSWDKCCAGAASTYNMRTGRSTSVTGPYVDSKGVKMADGGGDLLDKGDDRWKGPGHNGIFVEHDTVFLVNHAYDAQANGASILWIRPLYWTPDGWPTLDKNAGKAVPVLPSRGHARSRRVARVWIDPRGRVLPQGRPASPAYPLPAGIR